MKPDFDEDFYYEIPIYYKKKHFYWSEEKH